MMAAKIRFTGKRVWDVDRNSMVFEVVIDGQLTSWVISREALEARFESGGDVSAVRAFEANRAKIEAVAEALVNEGCLESSGEIILGPTELKQILPKGVRSEQPEPSP